MAIPFRLTLTDVMQENKIFSSIDAALSFIKSEIDFWSIKATEILDRQGVKNYSNVLGNAMHSHNHLRALATKIENIKLTFDSMEDSEANRALQSFSNEISNLRSYWVSSDHPFISHWLQSYRISPQTGDAFYEAIVNKQSNNASNYQYLKGYILAYEFSLQGESELTKRRIAETKAFERLRSDLFNKKNELVEDVGQFQKDISQWVDETKEGYSNWHAEQVRISTDESTDRKQGFDSKMEEWNSKIKSLEDTYVEKLRFNGPATYWKKQSGKYRCQGIIWTLALIAVVSLALVYFREFFLQWANGQRLSLNLASLEGAVIFAAILSSFIFLSRIFSRLAFSSFHLQRDAEEREQLTHLYLALGHEDEIDVESRKIILQALFSRSETGLISNESGPTMPGLGEAVTAAIKKG